MTLTTRATYIRIPLPRPRCRHCSRLITDYTTGKRAAIAANIYVKGRWNRIEMWHPDCYFEASEPYGAPIDKKKPSRVKEKA